MTVNKPESDEKKISDLKELQHNVHEFEKALNSTKDRLTRLVESLKVEYIEKEPEIQVDGLPKTPTNKISIIDQDLYRFTQTLRSIHLDISYLESVLK